MVEERLQGVVVVRPASTDAPAAATATPGLRRLVRRGRGWRHEGRVRPVEAKVEIGLAVHVVGLEALPEKVGPRRGFQGAHLLPDLVKFSILKCGKAYMYTMIAV